MKRLLLTSGGVLLALVSISACSSGESRAVPATPAPPQPAATAAPAPTSVPAEPPATPFPALQPAQQTAIQGAIVPRKTTVEEVLAHSHVIVIGSIGPDIREIWLGQFGQEVEAPTVGINSTPAPSSGGPPAPPPFPPGPFTNYRVQIETVLKNDGNVTEGGALALQLFGHLSNPSAGIGRGVKMKLPNVGDRVLIVLSRRNENGTYSTHADRMFDPDAERATHFDGMPFPVDLSTEELIQRFRESSGP